MVLVKIVPEDCDVLHFLRGSTIILNAVGRASVKRRWASQCQTPLGEPVSNAVGRASVKRRWASQYQTLLGEPVSNPAGRASVKRCLASQYQTPLGEPVANVVGRATVKRRWASQCQTPLGEPVSKGVLLAATTPSNVKADWSALFASRVVSEVCSAAMLLLCVVSNVVAPPRMTKQ